MQLFSYIEPYKNIKECCSVEKNELSRLLRLLSGSLDVIDNFSGEKACLKKCYIEPLKNQKRSYRAKNFYKIISNNISLKDYEQILRNKENIVFFRELCNELTNVLWYENNNNNTTAFVYIYRTLEYISYAIPLLYVKNTIDFKSSFEALKSYFINSDLKSELKFFETFLKITFKGNPILEIKYDFNFENCVNKKSVYNICKRMIHNSDLFEAIIEDEEFKLNWINIPMLIINIRNGFFHFRNSMPTNITSEEIGNSDYFFKIVNPIFITWVSSLFVEIYDFIAQSILKH